MEARIVKTPAKGLEKLAVSLEALFWVEWLLIAIPLAFLPLNSCGFPRLYLKI
jgi:hypothetical protein